uniref:Group 2 family glycosyl transferase protein n=1 Tax=uncultured bacterium Contig783 TaxID=1393612 RepID=W0FIS0_9BACT|nr:group 2 family glycosyl transferase protein [uncultured bacterium Contig783]
MKKLISVIAPMYNEGELVNAYLDSCMKAMDSISDRYRYEIVMVNDGSNDNTYELMKKAQSEHPDLISTVCLTRNFGLEGAVFAGLSKARGDAVVSMDADLQDPPEVILKLIEKWENGADVVNAVRVKRESDTFFKKTTAAMYYDILRSISGKVKMDKDAANFRLLSRKAVDTVLSLSESNKVFRVAVPFVGMKTETVEYERDKRYAGSTKYHLRNMVPYALDSITGVSVAPLYISFWAVVFFLAGFLATFISFIAAHDEWKVGLFCVSMGFLCFAVMSVVIAVISIYLAQTLTEAKGRPVSLIYEYDPARTEEDA